MADMDTAPKDGTRILILHHAYAYSTRQHRYVRVGTAISECWWAKGTWDNPKWSVWCGKKIYSSTENIDPISWAPIPTELLG